MQPTHELPAPLHIRLQAQGGEVNVLARVIGDPSFRAGVAVDQLAHETQLGDMGLQLVEAVAAC